MGQGAAMTMQQKAAPRLDPESGSIKTPDAGNSKPQAGPLATRPTISPVLCDRLELVASQMALLETLVGAARSLELGEREISGLFSLLCGWRDELNEIATQNIPEEVPAPTAPDPAPPAPAVPPLDERQLCLVGLLKASFGNGGGVAQ